MLKRSISPLIATILLIVVSVILVTVILTWGQDYISNNLNKVNIVADSKNKTFENIFWLDSITGNSIILKNLSDKNISLKGYVILTTQYTGFWVNDFYPLESQKNITGNSIFKIELICVPENKFVLNLVDINDNFYPVNITNRSNSNYTTCEKYVPPLWIYSGQTNNFTINEYLINSGNIVSNGGYQGANDWIDSDEDGLADNWVVTLGNAVTTKEIVTGNGFLGNAQKIYLNTPGTSTLRLITTDKNQKVATYLMSLKYRANKTLRFGPTGSWTPYPQGAKDIPANIDDAIFVSKTFYSVPANEILFQTGFSEVGDWIEVDEVYVEEVAPLDTIVNGTKYFQNINPGTISLPSKQAYGAWEFDVSVASGGFYIYFICPENKDNSYALTMRGTGTYAGRLYFKKMVNGSEENIIMTNLNYFKAYIWYTVRIERTRDNVFKFYIKGGDFTPTPGAGDWTEIAFTSGSNSVVDNSYLESEYLSILANSDDKISEIRFYPEE